MMRIDERLTVSDLKRATTRLWELSAAKIREIDRTFDPEKGAPVFTAAGRYTTRGWTEWTEGFRYGSSILQFDATGEAEFLKSGRAGTVDRMARHVSHTGVHDHAFNNLSTYGNLLRLACEKRIEASEWEARFYELGIKISAAVQAARWTKIAGGLGFIYSFNGPHSLFVDTLRTVRILAVGHQLGHVLFGEGDERISLLGRLVQHSAATARYSVYYGEGRDAYDVRGRTAHECVFNIHTGVFRCPSSQQGYSPLSTWTRGLAWAMLGFAEELEFLRVCSDEELADFGGRDDIESFMLSAALATCDFYLSNTPPDGVPYWDTGAPGLPEDWRESTVDPWNAKEPLDSSAAAIAAQGLLRLGHFLGLSSEPGRRYWQAGLSVLHTLFQEPYLSTEPGHQGLLLHSVYHRPRGWDSVPAGRTVPCGESSMWGDYHAREVALYIDRVRTGGAYLKFYLDTSREAER
jgi:unsaturated chondroitin disaccharide hydrolase